jgi:hypothetical protein
MTKLIVALRDFAPAPKNPKTIYLKSQEKYFPEDKVINSKVQIRYCFLSRAVDMFQSCLKNGCNAVYGMSIKFHIWYDHYVAN